jgi:hypothetical protein
MKMLFVAVALALALASAQPAGAIIINYRTLQDDITTLVPAVLQPPLLAKVDAAAAATDRDQLCAATNILGALGNQLRALSNVGIGDPNQIGDPNARLLEADVNAVLVQFPPDPCFVEPPDPE